MGEKVILVYLVVCFFVFLAGFVDSIAGGGGLISLPAYMIAGLPVHTAIATNKMSSFMGTSVATYHYMKKGFMKWKICIPAIFGAIAGSWMGSHLALLISDRVLKIAMVIVLPVILCYVLRSKALQGNDENTTDAVNGMLIFKCILIAVVIGIYDGIYGPGTGTFLMLLFTGIAAFGMGPWQGDMNAVIASCSEYTYLTKKKRVDGTMYSCTSLGIKLGGGIGIALTGWLLNLSGFDGTLAVQSASCIRMLQIMYLWIPVVITLIITLLMSKMNVERANEELRQKQVSKQDMHD